MGLQVRVRHALGERLVDLADRPVERPLIVGRAREADLKIPSVTVDSEHCALFVHNRQWVLQDTSSGATLINGARAEGPTPLCVGDVIVLGTDASPVTIVVDPAGVAQGRSGHPAETHDAVPVSSAATAPRVAASAPRMAASAPRVKAPAPPTAAGNFYESAPAQTYASTAQSSPAPAQDPWNAQPPAEDDPFAGWSPSTTVATPSSFRRRKSSKGISPVALGITIAACLAIVIGVAVAVILKFAEPPKPVVVTEQAPSAAKDNGPVTLFDMTGVTSNSKTAEQNPPPKRATADQSLSEAVNSDTPASPNSSPANQTPSPRSDQTPAPRPDQTPAPRSDGAPAPAAGSSPHKDGKEAWSEVRDAFTLADVGKAILKSEDYRHQHESESFKDLDGMVDEAMDTLWWNRVLALWAQQSGFLDDIKKKDKDIREETSAAFKKTLQDERKEIEAKVAEVQRHLNGDMGYTATEAPQLDNKEMMQKLRDDRDKDKFASWKVSTLKYIKSHHGSMPWDG